MALKEVLGIYCAVRNSRQSAKVICGTLIDKGVGRAELSSNGRRQARLVCALPLTSVDIEHYGYRRSSIYEMSTRCIGLRMRGKLLKVCDLVARDGVEPPTPAFSGLRSTT